MLFIESSGFTSAIPGYLGSDQAYADLQSALASQPDLGPVIAGAAPLRKLRLADPRRGKGRRGGLRVIYLSIADLDIIYLLDVYGKDEADDLSPAEKSELKEMARTLEKELRRRRQRNEL